MKTSQPTRRDFIKGIVATGAAITFLPSRSLFAAANAKKLDTISILHTTDIHGHILPTVDYDGNKNLGGLARCASMIRRWRQENPQHMLLDIGDVYQGTDVSYHNRGKLMIELFNHMKYDAWVIGNHEFDWGMEPLTEAFATSKMPVLTSNLLLGGRRPGEYPDAKHPYSQVKPYIIKKVGKYKIGVVGTTTPGLDYWLHPNLVKGVEPVNPIEPLKRSIAEMKADGANAIICAAHMGWKRRDNFANMINTICAEIPEIDVVIAGHTHKETPNSTFSDILYTQAGYHGIWCGKVDLSFNTETGQLATAVPHLALMDSSHDFDPTILEIAAKDLELTEAELDRPVGELADKLSASSRKGKPSEHLALIGTAIREALKADGVEVDGVLHGTFGTGTIKAGKKTVSDIWKILPYENMLVSTELTADQLEDVVSDALGSYGDRNLLGFKVFAGSIEDGKPRVDIRTLDDKKLDSKKIYRIALNTFDAQSGGQSMMILREILQLKSSNTKLHKIQTRTALIEYFLNKGTVHRADLFGLASK